MIEYVVRKTYNKVKDIVNNMNAEDILTELDVAYVNHSLTFEEVCNK